jgi:hypothetical protein
LHSREDLGVIISTSIGTAKLRLQSGGQFILHH